MWRWATHGLRRATTYFVRQGHGARRVFRRVPFAFPVVRHHHPSRASIVVVAFWLVVPGLGLLGLTLANTGRTMRFTIVDFAYHAIALVLAVNAVTANVHWSVRAVGLLCSLSLPFYTAYRLLA